MISHWVRRALKILVLVAVALVVFGFAVMLLWNALVPPLFDGPKVSFWQALGLLVLSRLLVGGLRGRPHDHWRHRMRERWKRMTPEERARFRSAFHHSHCRGEPKERPET